MQITWPPEISVSVILRADLYLVNNSYSLAMKTIASGFKHLYDVIKSSKYLWGIFLADTYIFEGVLK